MTRQTPSTAPYRTILALGLPIIGGMLSQSLLNLVDAALVGRLGEAALAGVGAGSYANFVAISLILGLSSGVQAMVARRKGQNRHQLAAEPVNWAILLALLVALPLSLLFISLSPWLTGWLAEPTSAAIARQYFDYRTAAMSAVALNLALRGWWNGSHRPASYVRTLLAMHLLNVVLSYGLIFGRFGLPEMGAPGAGLGTAIALYVGCALNGVLVWRDARHAGFLRRLGNGYRPLRTLLALSIPHSLQQLFMALGILILFWIVGLLGTAEQAIAHVLINLALFLILPAVGFGVASTSLVSHALGAGQSERAYRWGWQVIITALGLIGLLSLPLLLIPELLLALFLNNETLVDQASAPLRLTALAICADTAAIVLAQSLLGAGANRLVLMISTSVQWLLFLPLAWLVGPVLGFGLLGIWQLQVLYRALSSLIYIRVWQQRRWAEICV
ncbi:MATE family efflux transporter [Marinobacterium arenosum]|uniref:MATE family efflux transporter n=1 Tax=Marinobacterium arenosum TaxID=2862496 RepID=UPI001C9727D9|nr:MATE family efflux transporter [Marinobacterium arenosum]MBY4675278.1 MATE family efflux transporter [Marinobacterium arenosum]